MIISIHKKTGLPALLAVFIICFFTTRAQNNDSLRRIFNNSKTADTIRVNALQKIAENYAGNNADSTIILQNKFLNLPKKGTLKNKSQMPTCLSPIRIQFLATTKNRSRLPTKRL